MYTLLLRLSVRQAHQKCLASSNHQYPDLSRDFQDSLRISLLRILERDILHSLVYTEGNPSAAIETTSHIGIII